MIHCSATMKNNIIDVITLGCSKNLVDSEMLMKQLAVNGYKVRHDPEDIKGRIAVVNTCGFIGDAKEESINMILELADLKEEGKLDKLYVMGCLSERYLNDLKMEIPQVDKFYGKFDWQQLINDLGKNYDPSCKDKRVLTTPPHYAYLKIAEGCNRHCAYCAIPIITGNYKSRPMDEILAEAEYLASTGVKELQVIAQDLTYYGMDTEHKLMLPHLIDEMANIKGIEWIRLHYAYPTMFPYDLLKVMRDRDNVCRYLDIALQHISDNVLTAMRRHITSDETYRLIERIREEVPGIHLRTTLMVGFPGETDEDFEQLKKFVSDVRFERMGAFMYSEEDGTYAANHYTDDVPQDVKQARLDELMYIQQEISADLSANKIGNTYKVVIDRQENEYYVGRTEFDSPEVDPEVLIKQGEKPLTIGSFHNVRITDSDDFDLYGEII